METIRKYLREETRGNNSFSFRTSWQPRCLEKAHHPSSAEDSARRNRLSHENRESIISSWTIDYISKRHHEKRNGVIPRWFGCRHQSLSTITRRMATKHPLSSVLSVLGEDSRSSPPGKPRQCLARTFESIPYRQVDEEKRRIHCWSSWTTLRLLPHKRFVSRSKRSPSSRTSLPLNRPWFGESSALGAHGWPTPLLSQ
jgi:hypothetical protein